jgi:hypothetical protein
LSNVFVSHPRFWAVFETLPVPENKSSNLGIYFKGEILVLVVWWFGGHLIVYLFVCLLCFVSSNPF